MKETWYGWNLASWTTRHFARKVGQIHTLRRKLRKMNPRHRITLQIPRVLASWGGLWKPMRVSHWRGANRPIPPFSYRWAKARKAL